MHRLHLSDRIAALQAKQDRCSEWTLSALFG